MTKIFGPYLSMSETLFRKNNCNYGLFICEL